MTSSFNPISTELAIPVMGRAVGSDEELMISWLFHKLFTMQPSKLADASDSISRRCSFEMLLSSGRSTKLPVVLVLLKLLLVALVVLTSSS